MASLGVLTKVTSFAIEEIHFFGVAFLEFLKIPQDGETGTPLSNMGRYLYNGKRYTVKCLGKLDDVLAVIFPSELLHK